MSDSKSLSRERFGQFAAGYVTNQTHAKGSELDRLIEIAQPQPYWIVLDVATGGGHTALKFAPHVAQVIASDLTPQMLEEARTFITGKGIANVEFKLADAEDLPFEDGRFDVVLTSASVATTVERLVGGVRDAAVVVPIDAQPRGRSLVEAIDLAVEKRDKNLRKPTTTP